MLSVSLNKTFPSFQPRAGFKVVSKISTLTPLVLNFRVRIRMRFEIKVGFQVRVRVKNRIRYGMVFRDVLQVYIWFYSMSNIYY